MLQVLFLGLFAYIFGSIYEEGGHIHNMNVLYVDYDGGVIGASVRDAYNSLKGDEFPTLQERATDEYPTPGKIESAVCGIRYWGAIYTSPGATSRLSAALGGGSAAATYNRSDVLTYVWNEARYASVIDSTISSNLNALSAAARVAYFGTNGTGALQSLSTTDATAISVFGNPWELIDINIQPTIQGSRLIYNTLVIILILIQEFFYLGTINGLYVQFKIYSRLYPHRIILYRYAISLAYTFVGSLCVTGMIWAFRKDWSVNGNQFVLCWIILWLFAHANFLCLDVFTVWLPLPYVPMALISWIVFNVTSILIPFELSNGFYRWAYAMSAHEVYNTLVDIWSRGCNPQLHIALPVLFTLEVLGLVFSGLGVYRRCHYASIAEEQAAHAFQERLDAAMAFERKRDEEREEERQEQQEKGTTPESVDPEAARISEAIDREELADVIRNEDEQIQREKTKNSKICDFGPSFGVAYRGEEAGVVDRTFLELTKSKTGGA